MTRCQHIFTCYTKPNGTVWCSTCDTQIGKWRSAPVPASNVSKCVACFEPSHDIDHHDHHYHPLDATTYIGEAHPPVPASNEPREQADLGICPVCHNLFREVGHAFDCPLRPVPASNVSEDEPCVGCGQPTRSRTDDGTPRHIDCSASNVSEGLLLDTTYHARRRARRNSARPGHPSPDRGSGPWVLELICCGYADGSERFDSWDEADAFRQSYVATPGGHDRTGILSLVGASNVSEGRKPDAYGLTSRFRESRGLPDDGVSGVPLKRAALAHAAPEGPSGGHTWSEHLDCNPAVCKIARMARHMPVRQPDATEEAGR